MNRSPTLLGKQRLRRLAIVPLLICILISETAPAVWALHGDVEGLREEVAPSEGVTIPLEWGDLLQEMRTLEAIDLGLLNGSLTEIRGYGLTAEEAAIFDMRSSEAIRLDRESQPFLMYVFWTIGLVNRNPILEGPAHMYENLTSPIGRARYGSIDILRFTLEEQALVEDIALNSYRPCCNTPALVPDCSHGFAALGLTELLVAGGVGRDEIFRSLLRFNAFSFTDQYADIALFLEEEGRSWGEANATQIMGYSYSSLDAHQAIRKHLVERGLYDPLTQTYLLDPLARYWEPILILLATLTAASAIGLVGLVWLRRSPEEDAGDVEAEGTV